jgi:hypothetical protein
LIQRRWNNIIHVSMISDFPKLIVATEFPPNSAGGGGAIIRQMLKEWPVEKLFWWSCVPESNHQFGQRVAGHEVATIPERLNRYRRGRQIKCWLLEKFWAPWAKAHLQNALRIFRPDVIWAVPHGWSIPPLARVLPDAGINFHVSIHDYPDVSGVVNRFGLRLSREFAEQTDMLYAHAASRDAICRQMADDLQARTAAAGTITRAGLEGEDFAFLSNKPEPQNDSIRIAYAGTIIAGETFAVFVKALAQTRHRLPLPVRIDFFGDHSYRSREWFDPAWMTENGNLTATNLLAALKKCTWGFAPMELTDENPRYNRFSLPTKFVSYLAAGLPIITLGHAESTVVKMMSEYRVGLAATCEDPQNLAGQLLACLSEPNPKMTYRAEIQRCAQAEFDAPRMRAALYKNFVELAAKKGFQKGNGGPARI